MMERQGRGKEQRYNYGKMQRETHIQTAKR